MNNIRRIFFLTFLLCTVRAWCFDGIHGASGRNNFGPEFGYTSFRPSGINAMVDHGFEGFSSLVTFGIGKTADLLVNAESDFDGQFALHFFLPYRIEAFSGVTPIYARGWELMTSAYGIDVLRNVKAVDFVLAPGVYWGELKITHHSSARKYRDDRYDNPFVAPMLRGDLRINISRLSLGARVSYRYDLTHGTWKRKSDNMQELPAYKFRELQYMFYIAWSYVKKE